MRLGPIILAVIVVAALGAAGYHYVFRGFVAAQTSLAQISDDDWRRGADVMSALEGEVSPSAMMLAARVGNRRAQTLAGDALANGSFGYPFDPDKGASLLARAAEAGDVRAQIALSIVRARRTLDREPDLDEARRLMRAAAAQDAPLSLYAGAALALGFDPEGADFAEGERLLAEARRLRVPAALALIARTNWQSGAWASSEARYAALQEAVEAGSANAASILGRAYLYGGFGLQANPAAAVPLLERASHAGNAEARVNLGVMLYRGEGGLAEDQARARTLWELAAQQGDAQAQYLLGNVLLEAEDEALATRWIQVAADNGNAGALLDVARWHHNGSHGFPENKQEATNWFQRAADAGSPEAALIIGLDHDSDAGNLPLDEARAIRYLSFASSRGELEATRFLARIFLRAGPNENVAEGVRLMRAAADGGDEQAIVMMGAMYLSGSHVRRDDHIALSYFRRAPDAPMSQAGMGLFYYYGEAGLPRDRTRGIALMQTAARAGEEFAQRQLERWGQTW